MKLSFASEVQVGENEADLIFYGPDFNIAYEKTASAEWSSTSSPSETKGTVVDHHSLGGFSLIKGTTDVESFVFSSSNYSNTHNKTFTFTKKLVITSGSGGKILRNVYFFQTTEGSDDVWYYFEKISQNDSSKGNWVIANVHRSISSGFINSSGNITVSSNQSFANNPTDIDFSTATSTFSNASIGSIVTSSLSSGLTVDGGLTIPSFHNKHDINGDLEALSVVGIKNSAFRNQDFLTSATMPNSVTGIDSRAFQNCDRLFKVTLSNSLSKISDRVFASCPQLRNITIPSAVTGIEEFAFFDCRGLTGINIPSSVTGIGNSAFNTCTGLATINLLATTPPTVGTNVFSSVATTEIHVPSSASSSYGSTYGGLTVVADLS